MSAPSPWVLAVAPNGARRGPADHAALPIGPAALAAEAAACRAAGATMMHVHVRDDRGGHSLDVDAYRAALAAIRARIGTDMILQVTTEAVGIYRPAEQMEMVYRLRPEAVSLALRELVPGAAEQPAFGDFLHWLRDADIAPQFILYGPEDLICYRELLRAGVIPGRAHAVLFVLGRYSAQQRSTPADLLAFLDGGEGLSSWMVCAFGPQEAGCALTAAGLGGHARIGFENNLYMADGALAPDNAALIKQAASAAGLMGRGVADPATARRLLAPDW